MRVRTAALIALAITTIAIGVSPTSAKEEEKRKGLIHRDAGTFDGYTLLAPMHSTTTYLVDMDGNVVHTWEDEYVPGQSAYLLGNGHLLRCVRENDNKAFRGGGIGGRIRELDWDGNVVWDFDYSDDQHCQHHDIEPLPNGNVLLIAWEKKTADQAYDAGRDPDAFEGDELWPDKIVEVARDGKTGGKIVWAWHAWDHLVQDVESDMADYGNVADHPELIDINYTEKRRRMPPDELEHLRAIGYVGGDGPPERGGPGGDGDWLHINAVCYNPTLDQIVVSVHSFSEIWIIDHSTTTKEAAGHTGGRSGKGGDLLYRWGNPQAYRAGGDDDRRFFAQHDARWVDGENENDVHITVFNNGRSRPDGDYSSVDEIALPITRDGKYAHAGSAAFAPTEFAWSYTADNKSDFFAGHISGAQRLPNGNTLVCSGEKGRIFEVDTQGKIVWEFMSPFEGERDRRGGGPGLDGPPRGGRRPGRRAERDGDSDDRGGDDDGPTADRRPRGGRRGGPPKEANALFRATRIAPDHPALKGRDLSPKPIPAPKPGPAKKPARPRDGQ